MVAELIAPVGGDFKNAALTGNTARATMTTLNDSTGVFASGVTSIEFKLLSPIATQFGSGGTVYRDVAVIGTATPLFDANTSVAGAQDGAGVWNTTTANFYSPTTLTDQLWSNSTNSLAMFGNGGTAGTVTVGTVNTNSIQFGTGTGTYNLTGGTITFGGVSPTINTVGSAIINSNINCTGGTLATNGAGNLNLGGTINAANLYTNGTGIVTLTGSATFSKVTFIQYGTFNVSGSGSITSPSLIGVGGNAGNVATWNINTTGTIAFSNAGTGSINTIGCQAGGLGVVNQTSGNMQIGGDIALGYFSTSASGAYNLMGTGNLAVNSPNPGIVVAWGGTGSFYQGGNSTLNDVGYLYVGGNYSGSGAVGVATFAGGTANLGTTTTGAWATNLGFNANSTGVLNIGTEAGGNATVTIGRLLMRRTS